RCESRSFEELNGTRRQRSHPGLDEQDVWRYVELFNVLREQRVVSVLNVCCEHECRRWLPSMRRVGAQPRTALDRQLMCRADGGIVASRSAHYVRAMRG